MTMNAHLRDQLTTRLLEDFQRDLPLVSRPFAEIAGRLASQEETVIAALQMLVSSGAIARVGGVVKPNTFGASTLAALAAPALDVERIAGLLTSESGINHVYLRENALNIWFVATGPDRAYVDALLARVQHRTHCDVLDLRLERPYHIDLGFALDGGTRKPHSIGGTPIRADFTERPGDRELLQMLTDGMPLVAEPFAELGRTLARSEESIIERLKDFVAAGVVPRMGVIVRHRALGWRSNAMVVWQIPEDEVDAAGTRLATAPGINLCYRRTTHGDRWPFNLYCMVHARSREEALELLADATGTAGLDGYPRQILFSLRCFKQTGALLTVPKEAA